MSSKKNPPAKLDGRTVFVIGNQQFYNRLLCYYLETVMGVACIEGSSFDVYEPSTYDGGPPVLFLIDCLGKDIETYLAEFEQLEKMILPHNYVAAFNVDRTLDCEERALARGIRGFFYEQDTLELFSKGVGAIFSDDLWVSRNILTKHVLNSRGKGQQLQKSTSLLTLREQEILTLIAAGAKNEEIADKLYISPNTVRTHIYNIFKKINVPNRLQAALWAVQNL
jgi:DNA-binding NarL/FixJ family response regulator